MRPASGSRAWVPPAAITATITLPAPDEGGDATATGDALAPTRAGDAVHSGPGGGATSFTSESFAIELTIAKPTFQGFCTRKQDSGMVCAMANDPLAHQEGQRMVRIPGSRHSTSLTTGPPAPSPAARPVRSWRPRSSNERRQQPGLPFKPRCGRDLALTAARAAPADAAVAPWKQGSQRYFAHRTSHRDRRLRESACPARSGL